MEGEFIGDLVSQGYEYLPTIITAEMMLANVRAQLIFSFMLSLRNYEQCSFDGFFCIMLMAGDFRQLCGA